MPKTKPVREKVVSVVAVRCYLNNPEGDIHRIALTNTGRTKMLDHTWETAKLLRTLIKPSCDCIGAITGKTYEGRYHDRAFSSTWAQRVVDSNLSKKPMLTQSRPGQYPSDLRAKVVTDYQSKITPTSPYFYAIGLTLKVIDAKQVAYRTPDNIPQVTRRAVNKQPPMVQVDVSLRQAVTFYKYRNTLPRFILLSKSRTPIGYTVVADGEGSIPRFTPVLIDSVADGVFMVRGWLTDPTITKLSDRLRFARAVITPIGAAILEVMDLA